MAAAQLKLHLDLGASFVEELQAVMREELEVASRKWNYYPNQEQENQIFVHAFEQLRHRINSVTNESWDVSGKIKLAISGGPHKVMEVPSEESAQSDIRLIRSRDGWVKDQDSNEDAVPLDAFPSALRSEIEAWTRTAIFYSVGSYKN